jgi:hypothetical protein
MRHQLCRRKLQAHCRGEQNQTNGERRRNSGWMHHRDRHTAAPKSGWEVRECENPTQHALVDFPFSIFPAVPTVPSLSFLKTDFTLP